MTRPVAQTDDELVHAIDILQGTSVSCATGGVSAPVVASHFDRDRSSTKNRLEALVDERRLNRRWDIGPNGACITYTTPDFERDHQVEFPEGDHA